MLIQTSLKERHLNTKRPHRGGYGILSGLIKATRRSTGRYRILPQIRWRCMENHGIKFNPINNGASTTDAASQELLNTIQRQLKSLNHKDIDTAYTYSSKEFQTKTSLADLQVLSLVIQSYWLWVVHLKAHSVEGSQGRLELELEGHGNVITLIISWLKKEMNEDLEYEAPCPHCHCIETNSLCCWANQIANHQSN